MQFELKPDIARIYDNSGKVVEEVSADAVAKAYFAGGSIDLGLLPPAVRWVSSDGLALVLERPPQEVTIVFNDRAYDIPVPWTVWGMQFNKELRIENSFLFARPYPLSTIDDELFAFPLPNMGNDSSVALPHVPSNLIGTRLLTTVEAYWSRPFNGAFSEILQNPEMIPDEWLSHTVDGIEKYLIFLSSQDIEDITFADLKPAQMGTFGALTETFDQQPEADKPQTTMEFFQRIVESAKVM